MRPGEDPRDIQWKKSASVGQHVLRERAREARPDVSLPLDNGRPDAASDDWDASFERRVRDVASRAVAHLKRGDAVAIRTTSGEIARSDRAAGADPVLRFLALVQPLPARAIAPTLQRGQAK